MSFKIGLRRQLLRTLGSTTRATAVRRGSLIIPPAGPGSMGDEAMVEGLAHELQEHDSGPVYLYKRRGAYEWPDVRFVDVGLEQPASSLGAARLLTQHFKNVDRVFVIGADCLDGYYSASNSTLLIDLCDVAQRCGAAATITGSSFRENPSTESISAIRALHPDARLCARDPVSAERMERITGRKPHLVADAAFLLPPDTDADSVRDFHSWADAQRSNGRVVLGVNFNHQVMPKNDPKGVSALSDSFTSVLSDLLQRRNDVSVACIPHDYRGSENDLTHLREIHNRLTSAVPDGRIRLVQDQQTPGQLKGIADACDVVLTGRMHFAIASLGCGKPVACVTYQGKFEGLFKHFEIDPFTIAPEDATDPQKLASLVEKLIAERSQFADQIATVLPQVKERSLFNLGLSARSNTPVKPLPSAERRVGIEAER